MMEVTQKVDLKELPTEEEIMRSIAAELDQEVDKLTSPDIALKVSSRKSTVDEELHNGLEAEEDLDSDIEMTPPSDSIAIDKCTEEGVSKERDAGTDLDALLDKISSIVDCDPKEGNEEESTSVVEGTESKEPVDDIDNKDESKAEIDNTAEVEQIDANEEQKEKQDNNNVNVDAQLAEEEEEEKEENTLEETENKTNVSDSENREKTDDEKMVDKKEKNNGLISAKKSKDSSLKKPIATDKSDKAKATDLNVSSDEIFLDALESISSPDQFDALSEPNKPEESSPKKVEEINGLEDIISEEEDDQVEKTKIDQSVIELDSFEETLKENEDASKEDAMQVDQTTDDNDDEEKVTKDKVTGTQELRDDAIDEMLVEAVETSEAKTKEEKLETEAEEGKEVETEVEEEQEEVKQSEELAKVDNEELSTEAPVKEVEEEQAKADKGEAKEAESDDEVIFFEPIEKSVKEADEKSETETETKTAEEVPKAATEVTDKKDDEVVVVSEDEDEPTQAKQTEEESTKPTDVDANLLADNSDNACDQFEKPKTQEKPKTTAVEDMDSNSSNLLQPTQKTSEVEADGEGEAESQVDQADEADEEQDTEAPALKRLRLSTEDKPEASSSSIITASSDEVPATSGKRSHSRLSSDSPPEPHGTPSKKPKTDDTDSNSSCDGNLQIDLDAHEETSQTSADIKSKEPPIELIPTPDLQTDVKPLRLEFVKNFRKSFDKMTRQDLEELVLQKVVESMLVKSEFAEIRRQVDKHESTLASYRRKIAEVSKQFLDLETVHKRVLKDLETRNSHFTAPVRITRAVGLQVGMTLMKKPSDDHRNQMGHHTAGSIPAPSQAASTSSAATLPTANMPQKPISTQTQRSPMRGIQRGNAGMQHTQQQQLQQQQQQHPGRASLPYGQATATGTPPVRRGCMQKVTPQRPVNNVASAPQITPSAHSGAGLCGMQRVSTTQAGTSRVYATKHTGSSVQVSPTAAAAAAAAMRSRVNATKPISPYMAQKQQQQKLQQQQLLQQQQQQQLLLQQQQQQQQQPLPVRIGRSPGKQPNIANKSRQMPTVSVPMSSATESGAVVSAAGYGQPNLAPARPKEKAVIDLTDEDDAAAAAAAEAGTARLRQNANVGVKRNSLPSGASAGGGARPVAGSVVRVSPMSMPRANAVSRQIVGNNAAAQRNSLGANVTMQIRSENTPPGLSRMRYVHPAPLPLAPAQTFHPDWKLPPSRPVIRISLHDSGIVISWTLEDTGSRFAECVMYQIYAYQETTNEPSTDSWRHVGDVKAMLLPMAVTLNQFQENQRYFFAVRGVDAHDRYGVFSLPKTWE